MNIQYVFGDKIVLRNLGVKELFSRNTAEYFKDTVNYILSRYGIDLKNIYSITTDNGSNMLSMSRLMEQDLQASIERPDTA